MDPTLQYGYERRNLLDSDGYLSSRWSTMKEEDLLADLGPVILFFLATVVFLLGWLQTDHGGYLAGALLLAGATVYLFARLGRLYLR